MYLPLFTEANLCAVVNMDAWQYARTEEELGHGSQSVKDKRNVHAALEAQSANKRNGTRLGNNVTIFDTVNALPILLNDELKRRRWTKSFYTRTVQYMYRLVI